MIEERDIVKITTTKIDKIIPLDQTINIIIVINEVENDTTKLCFILA
jgi:hypothetical protein